MTDPQSGAALTQDEARRVADELRHHYQPATKFTAADLIDAQSQRIAAAEALLHYYDIEKVRAYFNGDVGNEPWRGRIAELERALAIKTDSTKAYHRDWEQTLARAEAAERDAARLHWLHSRESLAPDSQGYEWGIYRVKWLSGRPTSVLATDSDFRDLDAQIALAREAEGGGRG